MKKEQMTWGFSFSHEIKRLGDDWIPCKKELPCVTNECEIKTENGNVGEGFYYPDHGWLRSQAFTLDTHEPVSRVYSKITHWRYANRETFRNYDVQPTDNTVTPEPVTTPNPS